jgi:hypothetical protein
VKQTSISYMMEVFQVNLNEGMTRNDVERPCQYIDICSIVFEVRSQFLRHFMSNYLTLSNILTTGNSQSDEEEFHICVDV